MRHALNKLKNNRGYTLIELAAVIIIAGLAMVPAMGIYVLYKKNVNIERTNDAVLEARNAVGDFRALYGRYPCPARANAVQGDVDYGYESRNTVTGQCTAVPSGVWVATSNKTSLSNRDVFIGSLPFRQMNLPDSLVYDGYGNRIMYAVTGLLANDVTYNNANGGISIVDLADNSAIADVDSAHFMVLSSNEQDIGAYNRNGVVVQACPATGLEAENCDLDATFRVGQKWPAFDDLIYYNTADSIEQWQLSATNVQDIHLRRAHNVVMGVSESTNLSGYADLDVRDSTPGDAVMIATKNTVSGDAGSILQDKICDKTGTKCFFPDKISGQITPPTGEGMDCSPGYLVAIKNGDKVCSNQIWFSCPAGKFVTGFDANGRVVCNDVALPSCPDTNLNTRCGDSRTVSSFLDNGVWYGYAYSGQCYKIAALDAAHVGSLTSIAEVQLYIDGLNAATRTPSNCGPTSALAQTRDTFECMPSGSWNTAPVNTLERIYPATDLSSLSPLYNGGNYPAETSGAAFDAANPLLIDASNSASDHDCWCREDYQVQVQACAAPLVGNQFLINKHTCPQTGHQWDHVYPLSSTWNTGFCACAPGTKTENESCKSYLGYTGNGITGNVSKTYAVSCPSGPSGAPVETLTGVDTSACTCPALPDNYRTESCPAGKTNSFTYAGNGQSYTGVQKIFKKIWSCPGGTPPVTPISSVSDAGFYQAEALVHTQACVCDATDTIVEYENCPSGYQGAGRSWLLHRDCTTGNYEPRSDANLQSDDCHQCVWQAGTPRSGVSDIAAPEKIGSACPSCSGTKSCYKSVGPSKYKVWDGCYCAGQP